MNIVILGGGAAGATAAQFARKEDRKAEITVFEASEYPQYSRCGLPYALSGAIPEFESLIEFSAEWFKRNKIDLRLSTEVSKVEPDTNTISFSGLDGDGKLQYDSLIFATGARPSIPGIKGIAEGDAKKKGVFVFRGMDDAKALSEWCGEKNRKAVIVGAGLVGLEVAEALHIMGHEVAVVEFLDSILPGMIDPDTAAPLLEKMSSLGISARTRALVEEILGDGSVAEAVVKDRDTGTEERIEYDTVIQENGQKPSTSLAKDAGCALGRHGHIRVDERCESSVPGIYAVGDCAEYVDFVTGAESPSGMGTTAVKMGEVAGINAAGGSFALPRGFLNSRVSRLFGLEISAVGPISSSLTEAGIAQVQARVKGSTLPVYYPGGKDIMVKLTASKEDGKLLACQIVGEEGAGLRVNLAAAMILAGFTARDLALFETTYAPPVAPTVDVLATAAEAIMIKLRRSGKSG